MHRFLPCSQNSVIASHLNLTVLRWGQVPSFAIPGSYDIAKDIASPCFTKIENEHSIIIKINDFGNSVFRSEKPRFR